MGLLSLLKACSVNHSKCTLLGVSPRSLLHNLHDLVGCHLGSNTSAIKASRESGRPASMRFKKASFGRSESCRSPTSHSSLPGQDRALAGVLFCPGMCRILKL